MKKTVKCTAFILIGAMLFFLIQEVFIPDSSRKRENADRIIDGLEQIEPNTVDVLFLGPSGVEYGMSPMCLYENTGICGYSLATSGQPIGVTYWLLKDAFCEQKPSVVLMQASLLLDTNWFDNNIRWWHIMDNYRLNAFKFEMSQDYDKVPYSSGWLSALFPMIKYHTRWSELTSEDFNFSYGGEYYSLGEWITGVVAGNGFVTYEDVDKTLDILREDSYITMRTNNGTETKTVTEKTGASEITDYALMSFKKIKELCDENGAELVIFQIPKGVYPQNGNAWTKAQSEAVRELSQAYDVPFFDLQYDVDAGIDWTTDTCDAGAHLNIRGAERVADVLGEYLLNNYSLRQQSNPQYDAYAALYDKVREVALLKSEMDFSAYMGRLQENLDHWSVFIAASDEYTAGMDDTAYRAMEDLGLELPQDGRYRDSYMAIIDQGEVLYEAVSGRRIDYETELNGTTIKMSSAGWTASPYCRISINGTDYALGGRGLSIVVYDHESNQVIDSVRFDTCNADLPAYRDNLNSLFSLHAYEAKVCFGEDAA